MGVACLLVIFIFPSLTLGLGGAPRNGATATSSTHALDPILTYPMNTRRSAAGAGGPSSAGAGGTSAGAHRPASSALPLVASATTPPFLVKT